MWQKCYENVTRCHTELSKSVTLKFSIHVGHHIFKKSTFGQMQNKSWCFRTRFEHIEQGWTHFRTGCILQHMPDSLKIKRFYWERLVQWEFFVWGKIKNLTFHRSYLKGLMKNSIDFKRRWHSSDLCADRILNTIANGINEPLTGLNYIFQGFRINIVWNPWWKGLESTR